MVCIVYNKMKVKYQLIILNQSIIVTIQPKWNIIQEYIQDTYFSVQPNSEATGTQVGLNLPIVVAGTANSRNTRNNAKQHHKTRNNVLNTEIPTKYITL